MKRSRLIFAVLGGLTVGVTSGWAGPYSPASDEPGSMGIAAANPYIIGWATSVVSFNPGPTDISVANSAVASFGVPGNALGPSDATVSSPYPVVSLGDGGSITLSFAQPIVNNNGPDIAVFENGFHAGSVPNAYFLELAYVAVSSDGVDFFTFPSISLTQNTVQVSGGGTLDPTNIYDLAGKDIVGYGTPFDLSELAGVSPLLNINSVTQVRITDVVGSINPLYARYDSLGNIINDPWETDVSSSGFDLDAIAVLAEPIPEPSSIGLMLLGLAGLGAMYRARKRRASASRCEK